MNLGQILAQVETELQYAPELEAHRKDFRHVVNACYQDFARKKRWPWLQRKQPVWALPDFTAALGTGIGFEGVTQLAAGNRAFEVDRSVIRDALGVEVNKQVTTYLQTQFLGGELRLTNEITSIVGDGNWERAPFVIESFQQLDPSSATTHHQFRLDPRCNINSIVGNEGTATFSFPRILLPPDVDALDSLVDDDGNVLYAATPSQERRFLRETDTGRASFVVEDQGFVPNQGYYLFTTNSTGGAVYEHSNFVAQTETWPVRNTFTLGTINPTVGSMVAGTKLRIFLSWYHSGRFGPPSAIQEFTVDDFLGVKITGIPLLPQTTGLFEYGRRIAVFMAEGEGAFFFRGTHESATVNTFTILTSNTNSTSMDLGLQFPRWDEVYPGSYKYLRLNPRPSALSKFTAHYWKRPRQLSEDTDAPEFEEAYHELIVWLAVERLAARLGAEATLKRAAYTRDYIERQVNSRYFAQERYQIQKGMIGQVTENAPIQTIDWHGDS